MEMQAVGNAKPLVQSCSRRRETSAFEVLLSLGATTRNRRRKGCHGRSHLHQLLKCSKPQINALARFYGPHGVSASGAGSLCGRVVWGPASFLNDING